MSDSNNNPPTIATFLDLLEQQLPHRTASDLMEVVAILAACVPANRRFEVLEGLATLGAVTDTELALQPYPVLIKSSPHHALISDIKNYVRKLEEGEYFERFGWDEERREERAWGDESWAKEMDEFLGQAAQLYVEKDYHASVHAYGHLLPVFRHAHRIGVFCGPEPAQQMVQSNLDEAKRRFLRSLYIVSPAKQRASRLLIEMETLRQVGNDEISLRMLTNIDQALDPQFPEFDTFLEQWVVHLKSSHSGPKGWNREVRRLLREAVELMSGVDGLGELARVQGSFHPEAYHEWVGMLVQNDQLSEAVDAAQEGVSNIQDDMYRARMADRLATLAVRQGDTALTLDATRAAWKASPTEVRLLHLVAAAEAAEMRASVLSREAQSAMGPHWQHSDALACRLLLLAGQHEQAIERFQRADALGWGRSDHAGVVVLPFLLLSCAGLDQVPAGSSIESLWQQLDKSGRNYFDRRLLLDRLTAGAASWGILDNERPYSELLVQAMTNHPVNDELKNRMLEVAQTKVNTVINHSLNGQHRRGPVLAASLTAAVAECLALTQCVDTGLDYIESMRTRYQQFAGFLTQLSDHLQRSPVLNPGSSEPPPARPPLVLIK